MAECNVEFFGAVETYFVEGGSSVEQFSETAYGSSQNWECVLAQTNLSFEKSVPSFTYFTVPKETEQQEFVTKLGVIDPDFSLKYPSLLPAQLYNETKKFDTLKDQYPILYDGIFSKYAKTDSLEELPANQLVGISPNVCRRESDNPVAKNSLSDQTLSLVKNPVFLAPKDSISSVFSPDSVTGRSDNSLRLNRLDLKEDIDKNKIDKNPFQLEQFSGQSSSLQFDAITAVTNDSLKEFSAKLIEQNFTRDSIVSLAKNNALIGDEDLLSYLDNPSNKATVTSLCRKILLELVRTRKIQSISSKSSVNSLYSDCVVGIKKTK